MKELRRLAAEVDDGQHRPETTVTLGHVLARRPEQLERIGRALPPCRGYRAIIDTRPIPALGKIELRPLTA